MAAEIINLGFTIDSSDMLTADERMHSLDESGQRLEKRNTSLADSFRNMSRIAASAGVLGFGALVNSTTGYVDALAEVSTLVDESTFDMDALSASALEQSNIFGGMPTAHTGAFYQAISAGASTVTEATDTMTAANKLAVGGVTDVLTAVDGLTSAMNAYGDEAGTATDVSDAMFVAVKAGKTTIGELSGSIGQLAPIASQAGVSLDEVMAATAALTKGGVSTSVAMNGLRAVMAATLKPSSEATKLAAELGLEFNSTALEAKGLSGFLADITEKTKGNSDQMAILFGGVEALAPVMALTGSAASDFYDVLDQMENKSGATEAAFRKMANSPGFQMQRILGSLASGFTGLGTSMVQNAVPAMRAIADAIPRAFSAINSAVTIFKNAWQDIQQTDYEIAAFGEIEKGSKLFQAFVDTVKGIGQVLAPLVPYLDEFALAVVGVGVGGTAIAALAAAFSLLTSPITLTVGLIAGLAVAATHVYQNWDGFKQWWSDLWSTTVQEANNFVSWWNNTTFAEKVLTVVDLSISAAESLANGFFGWWNNSVLKDYAPQVVIDGLAFFEASSRQFFDWWNSTTLNEKIAAIKTAGIELATSAYQGLLNFWERPLAEKVLVVVGASLSLYERAAGAFFGWWNSSTLKEHAPQFVVDGLAAVEQMSTRFFNWWNTTTFTEKVAAIKTLGIEAAQSVYQAFITWWEKPLSEKVLSVVSASVGIAEGVVNRFFNWWNSSILKEIAPQVVVDGMDAARALSERFFTWWNTTDVEEKILTIKEVGMELVVSSVRAGMGLIGDILTDLSQYADFGGKLINVLADSIRGINFGGIGAAIGAGIATVITGLISYGVDMANSLGQGFSDGADSYFSSYSLLDLFGAVLSGIGSLVAGIATGFYNAFRSEFERLDLAEGLRTAFEKLFVFTLTLPQRMFEIAGDIVQGLINGFGNTATEKLRAAITFIAETIPNWFKSILGIQSPSTVMYQIGVDTFQGLINGIVDTGSNVVQAVGTLLNDLLAGITGFATDLAAGFASLFEGVEIVSAIEDVFNGAGETLSNYIDAIIETAVQFGADIQDTLAALFDGVDIVTNIQDLFSSAGETLSGYIDAIIETATQFGVDIQDALTALFDDVDIVANIQDLFNSASETLSGYIDAIVEIAVQFGTDIQETFAALFEDVDIVANIQDLFDSAGDTLSGYIDAIIDTSVQFGTDMQDALTALFDDVDIVANIQELFGNAEEMLSGYIDAIVETAVQFGTDIKESFTTAFDDIDIAGTVQETFSSVGGDMSGFLDDVIQTAVEFGADIQETFTSAFDDIDLMVTVQDAFSDAMNYLELLPGTMMLFALDMVAGFGDGFRDLASSLKTWVLDVLDNFVGELTTKITDIATGVRNAMEQIGDNLIGGIEEGVKGKWDDFKGFFGDKMEEVTDVAKTTFETQSPSKVFARIGGFLMEGLAVGVNEGAPLIERAIEGLRNLMEDGFSEMERGLANSFKDASNIREGLSQLGDHMSSWLRDKVSEFAASTIMANVGVDLSGLDAASGSIGEALSRMFGGASAPVDELAGSIANLEGSSVGASNNQVELAASIADMEGQSLGASNTVMSLGAAMGVVGGMAAAATVLQSITAEGTALGKALGTGDINRGIGELILLSSTAQTVADNLPALVDSVSETMQSVGLDLGTDFLSSVSMAMIESIDGSSANAAEALENALRDGYVVAFNNLTPGVQQSVQELFEFDIDSATLDEIAQVFSEIGIIVEQVSPGLEQAGLLIGATGEQTMEFSLALVNALGGVTETMDALTLFANEFVPAGNDAAQAMLDNKDAIAEMNAVISDTSHYELANAGLSTFVDQVLAGYERMYGNDAMQYIDVAAAAVQAQTESLKNYAISLDTSTESGALAASQINDLAVSVDQATGALQVNDAALFNYIDGLDTSTLAGQNAHDSAMALAEALGVTAESTINTRQEAFEYVTALDAQHAAGQITTEQHAALTGALLESLPAIIAVEDAHLQQVAALGAVTEAAQTLNLNFDPLAVGALGFADTLVELMGGIDGFSEATSGYYENFFTQKEREQIALTQSAIDVENFNNMLEINGHEAVTSAEGFRELVEGLDLSTRSGQELFTAAMEVSDAMFAVTEAGGDVNKIMSEMPQNLQDNFNSMTEISENMANQVYASFEQMQGDVVYAADGATQSVNNMVESVVGAFDQSTYAAIEGSNAQKAISEDLRNTSVANASQTAAEITNINREMGIGLAAVASDTSNKVYESYVQMGERQAQAVGTYSEALVSVHQAQGEKQLQIANATSLAMTAAQEAGSSKSLQIVNESSTAITGVHQAMGAAVTAINQAMSGEIVSITGATTTNVTGLHQVMGNQITTIAGTTSSNATGLFQVMGNQITAIAGNTSSSATGIFQVMGNQITAIAGATSSNATGIFQVMGNQITSIAGATSSSATGIYQAMGNQITAIAGATSSSATGLYQAMGNQITAITGATASAVTGQHQTMGSQVTSIAGATASAVTGQHQSMGSQITSIAGATASAVTGQHQSMGGQIASIASATASAVTGQHQSMGNQLKSIASSTNSAVTGQYQSMSGSLVNVARSVNGAFGGLVSSLRGINGAVGSAANAARSASSSIASSARSIGKVSIDGSHELGHPYIPFNGYIAELHKGERILTAEENRNLSEPRPIEGSVTSGQQFNNDDSDTETHKLLADVVTVLKEIHSDNSDAAERNDRSLYNLAAETHNQSEVIRENEQALYRANRRNLSNVSPR